METIFFLYSFRFSAVLCLKVFKSASLSDDDVNRYVIIRKLL
jgi:hypothetical protein